MFIFVYLIAAILALAYWWVKKRYNFWNERGFESTATSFPFGSLKGVATQRTLHETIEIIYNDFKGKTPIVGIYSFMSPTVVPIDPEIIKDILVREFSSFHDRGFYYNKKDDPLSANLLTLEGADWRERRVKLTPIFTSGKMKMMFDILDNICDKLINVTNQEIKQSKTLEVRDLARKFTSDVIGNVAFGLDFNCLEDPDSDFMKYGRDLVDINAFVLIRFLFATAFPDLCRRLGIRSGKKTPTDFFQKTFLDTLEQREKNKIKRNDFVSLLLGLKEHFTPLELAAESFLVYIGGFETSSTLMTFTLYELALHPEIQDRLREEIISTLDEQDGKLTYENLFAMKYLDMVVNESLRMYPPIPSTTRKCTKDYSIPNTNLTIPAGANVEISAYAIQRDPEHYPDPLVFDPERFTAEMVKARDPFTFLPFGEGPRNCIGMRFGMMQAKLALARLVRNFKVSPSNKTPVPMKYIPSSLFMAPVGGMWLNFEKVE